MPHKGRQFFLYVTFSKELFSRKLRFHKKNDILQALTDSFTDLSPLLRSK